MIHSKISINQQIIIIRSSVYPGICDKVYNIIKIRMGLLCFLPEVMGKFTQKTI